MRASLHTSMTLSFIGEAISRLRNNLKISDIFPPFLVQAKDKVASSYRTHFLTLSFTSKELEKEYQTHYAIRNLLQVRFAMTLGVILYSAFGVLDIWIIPEVKEAVWIIRIICSTALLLYLWFTFSEMYQKCMHQTLSIIALFAGGGILVMIALAEGKGGELYYAGMMLAIMWTCFFCALRFIYALGACFIFLIGYGVVAIVINNTSTIIFINNSVFLVSAVFIGMIGNYLVEKLYRKTFIQQIVINKKREQFEKLSAKLAKYLSPQVYSSIFSGERDVKIEAYRKNLTVFFSDIVDFTSKTEGMAIENLSTWLNTYLNDMANTALRYNGTVDKFIGDAVMIFFGDPSSLGEKQDALNCVLMGMEMREKAKRSGVDIRIGITTGECTVGNFGSEDKMDYTIIGRTVNLASRLESNSIPGQILISDSTYQLVKDFIHCEERGSIRVKGFAGEVMTYWVVNEK